MRSKRSRGLHALLLLLRVLSLVLVSALGTTILMREAPGYFTDSREADSRYAELARMRLAQQRQQESGVWRMTVSTLKQWSHGDLGRSRQYGIPVTSLLAARVVASARLLIDALLAGWLISLTLALLLASRRRPGAEVLISAPVAILLAIPTGALATLCLVTDFGGPLLVLATLIAVRDFKLLYRLLRQTWADPCLLHARAQGIPVLRIAAVHLVPRVKARLVSLGSMSFVLALSALVPVEVIFNVAGIGQLAFSAAMNRDLPVLLAVTMAMAACVGAASLAGSSLQTELL